MKGFRGELLGFTYNNVHSSSLGITRTSNGLYDKPLTTGTKDITTTVPGRDGQLYYGSIYNQRTININYAFEEISEAQIKALKRVWNDKGIHDLIFDEEPHKIYSAKSSGSAIISHICFERDGQRYYNGEGTL
jgi:predicted phage tail component-like protein